MTTLWRWCFGLMALMIGPLHIIYGASVLTEARRSKSWPTAEATVLSSSVVEHKGGRGTNYSPVIVYQYSVAHTRYTGNSIWLSDFGADRAWAERIAEEYPNGAHVFAAYDPKNPARAVLKRGTNWFMYKAQSI